MAQKQYFLYSGLGEGNFGETSPNEASFAITQKSSDGKQQGRRVINTEYLLQM